MNAIEARKKLGSLLDRVERAEKINQAQSKGAAERIRARAEALTSQSPLDWESLKVDRDLGRR